MEKHTTVLCVEGTPPSRNSQNPHDRKLEISVEERGNKINVDKFIETM